MKLIFPEGFLWGTATSAFQIETPLYHDWKGLVAPDGTVLEKTIDHEQHRKEDAEIIASLGNSYRCSLDWSRLQREPMGQFKTEVVEEYRDFLGQLKDKGLKIMLVLHHFANPEWFAEKGGWTSKEAVGAFTDYSEKMVSDFGDLASLWNTINEPSVYTLNGYLLGVFPPYKHNPIAMIKTIQNLRQAHIGSYRMLKGKMPETMVGVSNNTMVFSPESKLGRVPAKALDYFYLNLMPNLFSEVDFVGLSYYGRVPFRPLPVSEFMSPGELDTLGRKHDDMWEYHPEGLKQVLIKFWNDYQKPIIITEHGTCTTDDSFRIKSIEDHVKSAHDAIQEGVNLKGFYQWSAFDNWELHLGMSKKFGLVAVDEKTMQRKPKKSAEVYATIARTNCLEYNN